MNNDHLLDLLGAAAAAVERAVRGVSGRDRRARTDRAGQYAIDLVADAAALDVLARAPLAVLSEESGWSGQAGAALTVVLDPVDGSTNASRHIPYWATSLCVLDGDGPLVALVVNQATGVANTAVRGEGARRDGEPIAPGKVERVEDAVVTLSGRPGEWLPWKQFRALGSAALSLCDVAAGSVDGLVDGGAWHAPWDYLGGLLICREAGAELVDAAGRELVVADPDVRRQLLAAATPALLEELRKALPRSRWAGMTRASGGLGTADLARLAAAAEAAARLGGRVVSEHFGGLTAGVVSKAPGDYVSEVDLRSEQTIREALERDAPGVAFFGEEGGGSRGDLGWVVDPLDGTANFLHGFPVVGVSVALVEAGRPVAGAVHAPLLGETYTAVRGGGAFRDGRPIHVADRPVASAICNTGFPFKRKHRLDDYRRVFEGAFLTLEDLRRAGAASLDLAWTAAGVFDGFFEIGLGAWDVAAGALLVTEAGGIVTDWAGDDQAWLSSGDILAAPAPVHRVLLDLARS